jgi:hypothetical protein
MKPLLKDWIQVISWGVAIAGGLIAAFAAIYQLRINTTQRKAELRWKQANLGRELVDEICRGGAGKAHQMLDYYEEGRTFEAIPEDSKTITLPEILAALDLNNVSKTKKSIFIRECFEHLFYSLHRLEHFIESDLLEFEDVNTPFEYYAEIMVKHKQVFVNYMTQAKYRRAILFLDRFQKWKEGTCCTSQISE